MSSTQTTNDVRIENQPLPVVIRRHDAVLASTRDALLVHEDGRVPVYYVPQSDVYFEHLTEPAAGTADAERDDVRYFSITASGGGVERGAWMFRRPTGAIERLAGYVGFDPDPFNITVG